jgi:hypothetical protein
VGIRVGELWQVFPHLVLMQPDWIAVSSDEFLGIKAVYQLGSENTLLFAIQEDGHEHGALAGLFAPLRWREFVLRSGHALLKIF